MRTLKSPLLQLVSYVMLVRWSPVLTISRLSRWSINYYNDTARQASQAGLDRQRANGGLREYYSEGDTREPTWLITGDATRTVELLNRPDFRAHRFMCVQPRIGLCPYRSTPARTRSVGYVRGGA
jgi:hypothetical protein